MQYYSHTDAPSVSNPYRSDASTARIDRLPTAAERHQMIAKAAYEIAERRGFAPGHELADWFTAEHEVNCIYGLMDPSPRGDH